MRTLTLVAFAALWVPTLFSATSVGDGRTATLSELPWGNKLSRLEELRQLQLTSNADAHKSPAHGNVALEYEGSTLWTSISDVAVQGDYAYCVTPYGMLIIDISNPPSLHLLSKLYLPPVYGSSVGVAIAVLGNHAYLADFQGGLVVINIASPHAPYLEGRVLQGMACSDVVVADTLAYVIDFSRLYVVNVANPASPAVIVSCDCLDQPYGLAISEQRVLVADGSSGLKVVNISDPETPYLQGQCPVPGVSYEVTASGKFAYVACADSGLQLVDVSNSSAPFVVGGYSSIPNASGVAVSGNYALVTDLAFGLKIIDISTPATPHWVADYPTGAFARAVTLKGQRAFIANWYSLQAVGIRDPADPRNEGHYDTPGYVEHVAVAGNYAYVADQRNGVNIVDVSDPQNPTQLSSFPEPSAGVAVYGKRVYLGLDQFWSLDVTNPYAPTPVCSCLTTVWPNDIAASEKLVYVADQFYGLRVINGQTCSVVGSIPTYGLPRGVALQGDHVYVACGDVSGGHFHVFDVSTPSSPRLEGSCTMPEPAMDVAVSGRYAYVAGYDSGLQVIDIADPERPVRVFSECTFGRTLGVAVSGGFVYATKMQNGTFVYDISKPRTPRIVGMYRSPGLAIQVAIAGNHAYVADEDGFLVLRTALCGDVDGSGQIDLSDAVYLINYIFGDGEPPVDARHGDIDCDGATTIADAVYLVNYIFGGGAEPCAECK